MDAQSSPGPGGTDTEFSEFVRVLPISGASVATFDVEGRQSTIWSSNVTALRLEELQFDLGQGPHWHALATGEPVLVPNVRTDHQPKWPLFAIAATELGVGAVFAFPMLLGAVTVGVVDFYRSIPGTFTQPEYVSAVSLCGKVAKRAVHHALLDAESDHDAAHEAAPAMRREIHQATGFVIVQLGITATEAFFVMRAYAFSNGLSMIDVANDVLERRLDFSQLPD